MYSLLYSFKFQSYNCIFVQTTGIHTLYFLTERYGWFLLFLAYIGWHLEKNGRFWSIFFRRTSTSMLSRWFYHTKVLLQFGIFIFHMHYRVLILYGTLIVTDLLVYEKYRKLIGWITCTAMIRKHFLGNLRFRAMIEPVMAQFMLKFNQFLPLGIRVLMPS